MDQAAKARYYEAGRLRTEFPGIDAYAGGPTGLESGGGTAPAVLAHADGTLTVLTGFSEDGKPRRLGIAAPGAVEAVNPQAERQLRESAAQRVQERDRAAARERARGAADDDLLQASAAAAQLKRARRKKATMALAVLRKERQASEPSFWCLGCGGARAAAVAGGGQDEGPDPAEAEPVAAGAEAEAVARVAGPEAPDARAAAHPPRPPPLAPPPPMPRESVEWTPRMATG